MFASQHIWSSPAAEVGTRRHQLTLISCDCWKRGHDSLSKSRRRSHVDRCCCPQDLVIGNLDLSPLLSRRPTCARDARSRAKTVDSWSISRERNTDKYMRPRMELPGGTCVEI